MMKKLNRRSFLKVVSGFVASVVALALPSKRIYSGEASTGIDPNSKWAKQKPLTVADIRRIRDGMINETIARVGNLDNKFLFFTEKNIWVMTGTPKNPDWKKLSTREIGVLRANWSRNE